MSTNSEDEKRLRAKQIKRENEIMAKAKKSDNKIALQPLDDRVLVVPVEAESVSAGGIVLPDSAKDKPTRGEVLAVGPGRLNKTGDRVAMSVKVGDVVLYGLYSGSDIKVGGKEHKIMRESDLLAIVD